jgi:hypothetical protein
LLPFNTRFVGLQSKEQALNMIYKYFPTHRVDVISDLLIRFSPLRSLNDPFESKPLVDISDELDVLGEQAVLDFKKDTIVDENGDTVTLEKARKIISDIRHNIQNQIGLSGHGNSVMDTISDSFGVLSLSRTKCNLLMWSHYASQGKGYVLSFDRTHQFFNRVDPSGFSRGLVPITYSTERPIVKHSDKDYYEKFFCSKPLDWHYEEEERIFCMYSPEAPSEGLDEFGLKIRLSILPREAITGVYLGYNSDQEFVDRITDVVGRNEIGCPLYKGFISESEYRVVFQKISS